MRSVYEMMFTKSSLPASRQLFWQLEGLRGISGRLPSIRCGRQLRSISMQQHESVRGDGDPSDSVAAFM